MQILLTSLTWQNVLDATPPQHYEITYPDTVFPPLITKQYICTSAPTAPSPPAEQYSLIWVCLPLFAFVLAAHLIVLLAEAKHER